MRELRPALILSFALLGASHAAVCLAQDPPPEPEWSVELGLEGEKSSAEKISDLNRQIMALKARGQQTPMLGDLYNDLGVLHARAEDWPQARDAFIHAVQAKPYDPDFHRNLGLVFQRLEDYDLAIAQFGSYIDIGGGMALDGYRLLAQAQLMVEDVGGARATYRRGLQAVGRAPGPEACRLALALARLEREHGESADAREVLESWLPLARAWRQRADAEGRTDGVQEAEAIEQHLVALYVHDGQLLEEAGLVSDAVELYRKAYDIAPQRDDLLPRIVGAHVAAGDVFQARVVARLARENHPERVSTWLAVARLHEAADELSHALDALKRAYELSPEAPGLRLRIGILHLRLGQSAEGRRYLVEIIEAADTPTEVVYNYAVSLLRDQMFAAAVPPLQRVTRETPQFAGGWLALAQAYRAREQYARAVEAYQRALELQPDARTAYNLGVTAGQAKQWDTALAAYDRTLELDPAHREAAYNRAVALMQAGRLAAADAAFAAYLELDPEHYRANLNRGVTLYRLGRHADAIAAYSLTLEIQETAEVWDNMGLAYQQLGDKQKADQCFKEAKKLRGES